MIHADDLACGDGTGPGGTQDWQCGPFGFWPVTFPWGDISPGRDGAAPAVQA
jgi:hypothetical protein